MFKKTLIFILPLLLASTASSQQIPEVYCSSPNSENGTLEIPSNGYGVLVCEQESINITRLNWHLNPFYPHNSYAIITNATKKACVFSSNKTCDIMAAIIDPRHYSISINNTLIQGCTLLNDETNKTAHQITNKCQNDSVKIHIRTEDSGKSNSETTEVNIMTDMTGTDSKPVATQPPSTVMTTALAIFGQVSDGTSLLNGLNNLIQTVFILPIIILLLRIYWKLHTTQKSPDPFVPTGRGEGVRGPTGQEEIALDVYEPSENHDEPQDPNTGSTASNTQLMVAEHTTVVIDGSPSQSEPRNGSVEMTALQRLAHSDTPPYGCTAATYSHQYSVQELVDLQKHVPLLTRQSDLVISNGSVDRNTMNPLYQSDSDLTATYNAQL